MEHSIIKSLEWRYACKKFNPTKKLSEKQLEDLKQAFNLTATSYGFQTIYMMVIEDRDFRKHLVDHSFGQQQVMNASHLLVIAYQDNISSEDVDDLFDNIHNIRSTPETILAPYRADLKAVMKNKSQAEQQEWSIRQAYIALGNLMTVCAHEKIDSCPMEGFLMEKYDEILGLKEKNLKSILLLPVGFRAEDDMFAEFEKVRKDVSDSVIEFSP